MINHTKTKTPLKHRIPQIIFFSILFIYLSLSLWEGIAYALDSPFSPFLALQEWKGIYIPDVNLLLVTLGIELPLEASIALTLALLSFVFYLLFRALQKDGPVGDIALQQAGIDAVPMDAKPETDRATGSRIALGLAIMLFCFVANRVLFESGIMTAGGHPHGLSIRGLFGWLIAWAIGWLVMRLSMFAWSKSDREPLKRSQSAGIWAGAGLVVLLMM